MKIIYSQKATECLPTSVCEQIANILINEENPQDGDEIGIDLQGRRPSDDIDQHYKVVIKFDSEGGERVVSFMLQEEIR